MAIKTYDDATVTYDQSDITYNGNSLISKILTETLVVADSISKNTNKVILNTISGADSIVKSIIKSHNVNVSFPNGKIQKFHPNILNVSLKKLYL